MTEDNLSMFMTAEKGQKNMVLPKIREHVPKASKMLENKLPNRISKKKFIENLINAKGKFLNLVKNERTSGTIDLADLGGKQNFYRSN